LLAHGWSKTHVLLIAALLTSVCVFLILALDLAGFRALEWGIMGFVAIIGICYAIEVFLVHPDWRLAAFHTLVPEIDHDSLYIAVGMLGATVMPHVIYLHSALVQPRLRQAALDKENSPHFIQRFLKFELLDVFVAMNGAWLINSAMILMAAVAFGSLAVSRGMAPVASIEDAHRTLVPLMGGFSALVFAVALLCSGLASSTVGVMAGQVIIEGFLDIKFPIFLRRAITVIPAIAIISTGLDPLRILVLSQVVLSFALPFALIPLLLLTGRVDVMRSFASARRTRVAGWLAVAVILTLNAILLGQLALGR
jgi:manganese transport protein